QLFLTLSLIMNSRNSNSPKQSADRSNEQSAPGNDSEMMANPLHELFLDELADIYNAEQQLIKTLPKMAKAAQSSELREAFQNHLQETEQHALRLEETAEILGETLKRKKCKAMEG